MANIDTLIRNGLVVSPWAEYRADVGIVGDRIVGLWEAGAGPQAKQEIDATGLYVLPGGVDPHTHLELEFEGGQSAGNFESGTAAAACGGTTTVIDFAFQSQGSSALDSIRERRLQADGKAAIDYSLHCGLTRADKATLSEMSDLVEHGITSFKLVLVNRPSHYVDDGQMLAIMKECSRLGCVVGVHAENASIAEFNRKRLRSEGKMAVYYHAECYERIAEIEAIQRVITLAAYAGAMLYIFHISTREGVQLVAEAQYRGANVFAETCPHYLVFTDEVYKKPDAANYVAGPPFRDSDDRDALWEGLRKGIITSIGSDDAAFTSQDKLAAQNFFDQIPNGVPGVDTRFLLLYTLGVASGRISINAFVDAVSTSPARIFGLFPQKGIIQPGSDADIVLLDPTCKVTLRKDMFPERSDYSIYENCNLIGFPLIVFSRGRLVATDGKFVGEAGWGKFVPRIPSARLQASKQRDT